MPETASTVQLDVEEQQLLEDLEHHALLSVATTSLLEGPCESAIGPGQKNQCFNIRPLQLPFQGGPPKGIASWHHRSETDKQHPASVCARRLTGTERQAIQGVGPLVYSACNSTNDSLLQSLSSTIHEYTKSPNGDMTCRNSDPPGAVAIEAKT